MRNERHLFDKVITILLYIILSFLALVFLFPFFWMISNSLKETYFLLKFPPQLFPTNPTLENYQYLLSHTPFLLWLKNSIIVTSAVLIFGMFINSLAAYAFAKLEFPGRDIIFFVILATLMIPGVVSIVPLYLLMVRLGWLDTYTGLIVPGLSSAFGIFFIRQYMFTIPRDLSDAAEIDGCTEFRTFWSIVLPLCRPALAALGILSFLGSWNNFLWPLIVTTESTMRTLPVGLAIFRGQYGTNFGVVLAGSTMAFLPVLFIFIAFARQFVEGIALTGLKG